jgi:hypothetical protein
MQQALENIVPVTKDIKGFVEYTPHSIKVDLFIFSMLGSALFLQEYKVYFN